MNSDPPTIEEIILAIKSLKSGEAPGHDNLNAELFKADPELAATVLQPLFPAILHGEQIPEDWTTWGNVEIPKKGSLSDCNNWRGISWKCFYKNSQPLR